MNLFGISLLLSSRLYGKRPWSHLDLYKNAPRGWWFLEVGSLTLEADYTPTAELPFKPLSWTCVLAVLVTALGVTGSHPEAAGALAAVGWAAYGVSYVSRMRALNRRAEVSAQSGDAS